MFGCRWSLESSGNILLTVVLFLFAMTGLIHGKRTPDTRVLVLLLGGVSHGMFVPGRREREARNPPAL